MGQGQIRIEDVERAFQDWRRRRSAGAGGKEIPENLWEHAVEVARAHGLTTTARRLRLNHTRLKHRCESEAQSSSGFVELSASDLPIIGESVVELEDAAGIRLRLVLRGASMSTVTAAAKDLWGAAR